MKLLRRQTLGASRNRPHVRRAFSTMLVIASMFFIGMAVMSMTTLFTHEARRTRSALAQAQLRQFLIAAIPVAESEIKSHPQAHDAAMPVPLEGAVVSLHIDGPTVVVRAAYRGQRARETLTFAEGKLTAATLDESGF